MPVRVWQIRSTEGGSTGLEFANARMEAADVVIAHALPGEVRIEVRDAEGTVVARGKRLGAKERTPMARLTVDGTAVRREQIWPSDADLGLPVILPGGEVGILTAWWNAEDHSSWRWSIELSNHR